MKVLRLMALGLVPGGRGAPTATPGVKDGRDLPQSSRLQRSWIRSMVKGKAVVTEAEAMFAPVPKNDSPVNGRKTTPKTSHGTKAYSRVTSSPESRRISDTRVRKYLSKTIVRSP